MPKELSKPKQTRKRIPRTCAQCRKRKQKCDSLKPCAVCKLRGEADLCDYSGAQPTRVLDEEDEATNQVSAEELKVLRQQVDDLEHAVTFVVNRPPGGISPDLPTTDVTHRLAIDMDELNLSNILSSFLMCRIVSSEFTQEFPIIQKVRRQCRLDQQNLPPASNTNLYAASGLSTYFSTQLNNNHYMELMNRLPTQQQSTVLLATYMKEYEWFHSCFNAASYTNALEDLYVNSASGSEIEKDLQAKFITMAISFAIARSAIVKLSSQSSLELNLPTEPPDRLEQSKKWLDMSIACLKCAEFEVNPQLESICCLIILLEATWFDGIVGGIEDLSLLSDLKSKAIRLAFDLSLHRDPSHRDPTGTIHVNPMIARERRMVWWALLSIDNLYSSLTGRMSSIIGLEAVDVFLPALSTTAYPEEAHEGCEQGCQTSTPATGIKPRMLIGYVGHEICRLPLQRTPLPTINDIHQAHRDLVSLEVHLPESYKLHTVNHSIDRSRLPKCSKARRDAIFFYMRYHYLFVKLHSPLHFIKKGQDIPGFETKHPYHRSAVVDHALLLLELRSIGNFSSDYIYANSMMIEASFSLALDYLYDPKSEVSNVIKVELQSYCKFLQNSQVWFMKRGLNILQCLMATWGSPPPNGMISWFSVNKPTLSPCNWIQGPYPQQPEVNSVSGTGETQNQLEQLPQAEPPPATVFDSPDHLSGGQQALNHASWPLQGTMMGSHSPPGPLPAQSMSSHYQQPQHHAQLADYNPCMTENSKEFAPFNQPAHAHTLVHPDAFHQFPILPSSARATGHYENSNSHDASQLANTRVGPEKGMSMDQFLTGVHAPPPPGSSSSGGPNRSENSHAAHSHHPHSLPAQLHPAGNLPIHNQHQLPPNHHYHPPLHHHHHNNTLQQPPLHHFPSAHHLPPQNLQHHAQHPQHPHHQQQYTPTHTKW